MKLTIYIWVMSFLIGFFATACGKTPEQWKTHDEKLAACKAQCEPRPINEWLFGFNNSCMCEEKK